MFVGMVALVVSKADCLENQMVMNMPLVNMGGKYELVLTTHISACRETRLMLDAYARFLDRLRLVSHLDTSLFL